MTARWMGGMLALVGALAATVPAQAQPVAQQITAADTALLFGGPDAEGGIGDWYLSNGVVEAIVDAVGPQPDLVGVVPPDQVPPIQSEIAPTGGTVIDLDRVGTNADHLPQLFLVGGLSTANFAVYDAISVPAPGVVRATGGMLLPPTSVRPSPCIGLVTDYAVAGSDPFLTITTMATNGCGAGVGLGNFLDAVIWTQRGLVPFSGGGSGFDHAPLDLDNPATSLEFPRFLAAPGVLSPADGVMDPANGTTSGEVAYGLLGVSIAVDADGAGPGAPTVTPVDELFGISTTLVSALGPVPAVGTLPPGATLTYVRRVYVGATNAVRAVSDPMVTELGGRTGFATGTLSGVVTAADAAGVPASIVVTRLGRCGGSNAPCTGAADCPASTCTDPAPAAGFQPGDAVTQIRSDAAGAFSGVVVPQGDYRLVVTAPERDDVTVAPVAVGAGETPVTIPPLAARGTLQVTVREKKRGRPQLPAKIVVHGVDGTPDPRFARSLVARSGGEDLPTETVGGGQHDAAAGTIAQGNVLYTTTGVASVPIRPGTYEVWATRGMEYGVATARVTVASGAIGTADLSIKRVLRTRDALSADFHVHSARSLDSSAPLEGRVASFAGEGVEVMVSTDHDRHVDYAPVIAALNLAPAIGTIPGVEVTGSVPNPPAFPNSFGHINAWPMPVEPGAKRDGAIDDEYVAPNQLFTRLRRAGGAATVIQYNHPRAGVSGLTVIGFFNSIGCGRCSTAIDTTCTDDAGCPGGGTCGCVGYQPDRPLGEAPNDILLDAGILGPGTTPNPDGFRNLDFDVMELENSAAASEFASLRQVRDDWFSLLQQGVVKPATGVSDSHRLTVEHPGWARTFVLGVGDDPAAVDVTAFNARVKAGAMLVAGGPYVEVQAKGGGTRAGMGETLTARGGKVALRLRVTSAAWVPVEEVRVIANGEVVARFDATTKPRVRPVPKDPTSSGKTTRLVRTLRLRLPSDAWVVVEAGTALPADGATPASPASMDAVEPGVVPYSATNPILVDVDGNGTFDAPGLTAAATRARTGRFTGITRAQEAAAARRGEYVPLHRLVLPAPR